MGASLLPPSGWAEVKRASEAGVEDGTLATKYSIPAYAIRKRRMREKWMTPQRLEAERAAKALAVASGKVSTGAMARMAQGTDGEGGMGHVVDEIAAHAEAGSLQFARLASKALERKKSLTIKTMGDAVAAVKGLRSVAGLDKETPVSINIGAWSAGSMRTVGADLFDP